MVLCWPDRDSWICRGRLRAFVSHWFPSLKMVEALAKKRIWAGHGGSATWTVCQITEVLEGNTPDRDRFSLLWMTLKEKLETIKTLDAEIVNLIEVKVVWLMRSNKLIPTKRRCMNLSWRLTKSSTPHPLLLKLCRPHLEPRPPMLAWIELSYLSSSFVHSMVTWQSLLGVVWVCHSQPYWVLRCGEIQLP